MNTLDMIVGSINASNQTISDKATIAKLREALGWFLNDPRFQVGVGGNPIAVDRMIDEARKRYQEAM